MEYRRNINNNKRKKGLLERFLEYSKLSDDDSLFDEDIEEYYSKNKEIKKENKEPEWFDMPLHYDDEELLNKLIMGELLNLGDIENLMERTMKEFKRTFSAPNKDIEIVFREFKGEDFGEVIKEIFDDKSEDSKDKDIESKDGDEDEKERT